MASKLLRGGCTTLAALEAITEPLKESSFEFESWSTAEAHVYVFSKPRLLPHKALPMHWLRRPFEWLVQESAQRRRVDERVPAKLKCYFLA
jgi:hypothetical protein